MKRFIAMLMILVMTSCSLLPRYNIDAPTSHITDDLEVGEYELLKVNSLPVKPKLSRGVYEGQNVAVLHVEEVNQLRNYSNVARHNTEALKEVSAANYQLQKERSALVSLAKEIETRSNLIAEKWADTEEQKREDADAHAFERTIYQILIGIAVIALFLL